MLTSRLGVYISRYGDFCAHNDNDDNDNDTTDYFTPCACARGKNNVESSIEPLLQNHILARVVGFSIAGHILLYRSLNPEGASPRDECFYIAYKQTKWFIINFQPLVMTTCPLANWM